MAWLSLCTLSTRNCKISLIIWTMPSSYLQRGCILMPLRLLKSWGIYLRLSFRYSFQKWRFLTLLSTWYASFIRTSSTCLLLAIWSPLLLLSFWEATSSATTPFGKVPKLSAPHAALDFRWMCLDSSSGIYNLKGSLLSTTAKKRISRFMAQNCLWIISSTTIW